MQVLKKHQKDFETFHAIRRDVENIDAKNNDKDYWVQVNSIEEDSWIPQAREGAHLIENPDTNNIYLYGGVPQEPKGGIAMLTLKDHYQCKWNINDEVTYI